MLHLYGRVAYADELHGWEPAGLALVEYTQDNPMLDAHREVLAAEFPRRKFETELRITVGGLRAHSGTYYTGRERQDGLAKLAELQQARKLGVVNGAHLISKTFDRDDHRRDEGTFVLVEASFTRPQWPAATPEATVSVQAYGPFGDHHLGMLVAAAWETFQHLVDAAPVATADAYWDSQRAELARPASGDPPVGAFMLIDAPVVTALGGATVAGERLEAFDWKPLGGDEQNGVLMQLGRRPEDTTGDRLARIRRQLRTL
jgi:hypothetical protein